MAGYATRTSSARHPSIEAKVDDALIFNLDHLMGSGNDLMVHWAINHRPQKPSSQL
jgi:hypothetical protein